mgnify:CR=1 FL=1
MEAGELPCWASQPFVSFDLSTCTFSLLFPLFFLFLRTKMKLLS